MTRRTWTTALVVVLLAFGWLSGGYGSGDRTEESTPTAAGPGSPRPTAGAVARDVRTARGMLAALRRVDRWPKGLPAYRRAAFGEAWKDVDHNGCNQRDDVLRRDAVVSRVGRQGTCDHDVLAGTWHDPYTGRTLTFTDLKDAGQAEAIQIDHVVPLAEVWRSGASTWSPQEREAYANDTADLLAVDGSANLAKGADDPAAWRPRKGYQCAYAQRWIATKHRWRLAADRAERAALEQMLGAC
ncbi:MAG: HNH endonuclease [Nocardioides sp.]|nr:HNH endonuclease [Nocardioides sp.]